MRFFSQIRFLRLCIVGLIFLLPLKMALGEEAASTEGTTPSQAAPSTNAQADVGNLDQLLNLAEKDVGQLSQVKVTGVSQTTNLTAPSNQLDVTAAGAGDVSSTGELLRQIPSVNARRTSGLNFDPRVRGYTSAQLSATANGMNQVKTRTDIDSLFSQIDPGIIDNISVIDGPYTALYGPGFAFINADLIAPPRYSRPETHYSTNFVYGSNAQTIYNRDNVISGAKDWGMVFSYGLRTGNDYLTGGGAESFMVPSAYQEWNGFFSINYDLSKVSRIQFDYVRNDMNGVELPGVIYDIDNSTNNQFNLKYTIQEDPQGPEQLVLQAWWTQTYYNGNTERQSKQDDTYKFYYNWNDAFYPYGMAANTGDGHLLSLGARALRTYGEADSAQLTVGADWRRYEQMYHEYDYDSLGNGAWGDNPFGIVQSWMDDVGALAEASLPMSDRLTVSVGGRVDYTYASPNLDDPIIPATGGFLTGGTYSSTNTLGMAFITGKYKLTEEYTLKAGTGFAMRAPDLNELYNEGTYMPYARYGNSRLYGLSLLDPEKNLQLDLGLDYKTEKFSYGVRAYYAMIRDYIMAVPIYTWVPPDSIPIPGNDHTMGRNYDYFYYGYWPEGQQNNSDVQGGQYQYVNIDLATILGGDLYGELKMTDWMTVYGTMSYTYGTNESPVNYTSWGTYGEKNSLASLGMTSDGLPGIYPLNGTVGVRVFQSQDDRWCLDFYARMVHNQDHVAKSLAEAPTPGFTVYNIKGYYRVNKHIRLNAEIQNLFNRYYTEPGSLAITNGATGPHMYLPEPGITAIVGVDARF